MEKKENRVHGYSEDEEEPYVMLVKSEDNQHVWQEFQLPLSLRLLEKWTNLENFWFQEVLTELNPNFHDHKEYLVENEKITFADLEHKKIYFVFGNEIPKQKSSNKTQNPFITDGIIRNFRKCTGCPEQVAIRYLETFSTEVSLDYKKSLMAFFESQGTPAKSNFFLVHNIDLNQLSFYTISKGELHVTRALIEQNLIDLDFTDFSGVTLLHLSCNFESFKTVKFLLENGCKKHINKPDNDGWTPLFYAAVVGNPLIIKLLVDNGADFNKIDFAQRSPLHLLAKAGRADAINYLVTQKGLNVNVQAHHGYTPLFMGIRHPQVVKALISSPDLKIDLADYKGHTPLQYAIQKREFETIELLIEGGADINAKDSKGFSALHFAISTKSEDIALLLIKLGADFRAKDNDGQTPLHISLSSNFPDLFKELVEMGENPNSFDPYFGTYPIQFAAGRGLHLLLDVFVESNADLNVETESFPWEPNQSTPLMNAVSNGHTDFVKKLLGYGICDINRQDKYFDQTPLHAAVESNDFEIVKLLVKSGAKLNIRDCFGRTPLIIAKQKKQFEIHQFLLENGAIESIQDLVGNNGYYDSKPMSKLNIINFHDIGFGHFQGEKLEIFLTKTDYFLATTLYNGKEHLCRKTRFQSKKEAIDTYCELHYLSTLPYFLKSISHHLKFKPVQTPSIICLKYGALFDISLEDTAKNMAMVLTEDNSLPKALDVLEKLCFYLQSLHQHKVIHKNLSLEAFYENSKVDAYVLGDLGTPLTIRANRESEFNAPELKNSNFEGHTIESDVYALGTAIFEGFCKEKYDRKKYPSIDYVDYNSLSEIISKCILPTVFDCLNTNPFARPTVEEVRHAIHEARRVFTHTLIRQNTYRIQQVTGKEPDELMQKNFRFQIYKCERIGEILSKTLTRDCYFDEKKIITFNEVKGFRDKLSTLMSRVKLAANLKDTKTLDILGKYVCADERNDDLITKGELNLLEYLIETLPEKDVFIAFDMLRILFLSPHLSCVIIHSHKNILKLIEEKYIKKFNSLTSSATMLMIFRVLCNMFNDSEGLNYWCGDLKRFSLLINLVISGMKSKDKNAKVTSISFCSNLTLNGMILIPIESIQWYKLLDFLLGFMKGQDILDHQKIALSFYRLIKENTNKQQIAHVQEISDIIYYWNIDEDLKTSIIECLVLEKEGDATKDQFEVDYGFQ